MASTDRSREVTIGILCLDTAFPKPPGHIRNPRTFPFPVAYRVVRGATPNRIVTQADETLLPPFIEAARELEGEGVAAITTSCGFLVLFQRALADALNVPVYASSLLLLPLVHLMIRSDQKVGLIVAQKRTFTPRYLEAVGARDIPVCIAGLDEQPEFREVILEGRRTDLDLRRLEEESLFVARGLAESHPDMGALLIECTDLPPFADSIQRAIRRPVFDIVTLTNMVFESLTRRPYGAVG